MSQVAAAHSGGGIGVLSDFEEQGAVASMANEWVGIAIDCEWAEPVARFYEGLLGYEVRDLGPGGRWAQLFNPNGGVHLNIQGDARYQPPVWPEQPGEQAKMLHFEVRVDDLEAAVSRA